MAYNSTFYSSIGFMSLSNKKEYKPVIMGTQYIKNVNRDVYNKNGGA